MRCLRFSCTMPVSVCLTKQAQAKKYAKTTTRNTHDGEPERNIIAHQCQKCPQADQVRKDAGEDMDIDQIKAQLAQGIPPAVMRTCHECGVDKGVSQFQGATRICRKCQSNKTRERMKAANKPRPADLIEKARVAPVKASGETVMECIEDMPPETKLAIEIGGQRINLCRECMRVFLGI
jgi:hypothetical protein